MIERLTTIMLATALVVLLAACSDDEATPPPPTVAKEQAPAATQPPAQFPTPGATSAPPTPAPTSRPPAPPRPTRTPVIVPASTPTPAVSPEPTPGVDAAPVDVFETQILADFPVGLHGYPITLTVSVDVTDGTEVSHAWQRLVDSRWLNEDVTDGTRIIEPDQGPRVHRVITSTDDGRHATSTPVLLYWVPLDVTVEVSHEYPQIGDIVTLRGSALYSLGEPEPYKEAINQVIPYADMGVSPPAPASYWWADGTLLYTVESYRWQERRDGTWEDMGATSDTVQVRSSGNVLREFRLLVDYGGPEPAESEAVLVVWGEPLLIFSMIGTVTAEAEASPEYIEAETRLLECVNSSPSVGGGFTSLSDILGNFSPLVKEVVEICETRPADPTIMFETLKRQRELALERFLASNPSYQTLLTRDDGLYYLRNLLDTDWIKQDAALMYALR